MLYIIERGVVFAKFWTKFSFAWIWVPARRRKRLKPARTMFNFYKILIIIECSLLLQRYFAMPIIYSFTYHVDLLLILIHWCLFIFRPWWYYYLQQSVTSFVCTPFWSIFALISYYVIHILRILFLYVSLFNYFSVLRIFFSMLFFDHSQKINENHLFLQDIFIFYIIYLISKTYRNRSLIFSSYPRVLKSSLCCISLICFNLCKALK